MTHLPARGSDNHCAGDISCRIKILSAAINQAKRLFCDHGIFAFFGTIMNNCPIGPTAANRGKAWRNKVCNLFFNWCSLSLLRFRADCYLPSDQASDKKRTMATASRRCAERNPSISVAFFLAFMAVIGFEPSMICPQPDWQAHKAACRINLYRDVFKCGEM